MAIDLFVPSTLYGPFRRLETSGGTQDMLTVVKQALSGEVWGMKVNGLVSPVVEAYGGPLKPDERGIEFYAFARPSSRWGRPKWLVAGPALRIDTDAEGREIAKLQVAFVKITQELLDAATEPNR